MLVAYERKYACAREMPNKELEDPSRRRKRKKAQEPHFCLREIFDLLFLWNS